LIPSAPELVRRGVSESELKPAYLFLAGCESDLAKLSKATKNSATASEHYAAARMWLQKVFGKGDAARDISSFEVSRTLTLSAYEEHISRLKRQIQALHDQNTDQTQELAQLQSSKRKIEDDYYYERNLRKKYQNRVESIREKVMR
jgi:chromosome segregation ATPase